MKHTKNKPQCILSVFLHVKPTTGRYNIKTGKIKKNNSKINHARKKHSTAPISVHND